MTGDRGLDVTGARDQRLDAQSRLLHHDLDRPHVERIRHGDVQVVPGLARLDLDGDDEVLEAKRGG